MLLLVVISWCPRGKAPLIAIQDTAAQQTRVLPGRFEQHLEINAVCQDRRRQSASSAGSGS